MLFLTKNTRIFHVEYEKNLSRPIKSGFLNIYARSKLKKQKTTEVILPQKRRKGVGKIRQETNSISRRAICSSFISSPEDKCSKSRSNSKTIFFFSNEAKLAIMSSQLEFCTENFVFKIKHRWLQQKYTVRMSVKSVCFVVVQGTAFKNVLVDSQFIWSI